MTIPVISHSHEGIRVNINGVVDVFGNAIAVAESYARHKGTCREMADAIRPLFEKVAKHSDWLRRLPTEEHGALVLSEEKAIQLQEGVAQDIQELATAFSRMVEHCCR